MSRLNLKLHALSHPAAACVQALRILVVLCALPLTTLCTGARAQNTPTIGEIEDGEIKVVPSTDLDRIAIAQAQKPVIARQIKTAYDTCLLPPLNLSSRPRISADQLRIPENAIREYQDACASLKKKKNAEAERHLRNAVHKAPRYAAAWVTLGQLLALQQEIDDAHHACWQGSQADLSYVPAYLCLADIAARAHSWDEVLKLTTRALELDPSGSVIAYEYHAAANLNLRNLAAAEKSALRALAIDADHREPRVHFVLAQIYEAKGDATNEALQLRRYLEHAENQDDIAAIREYLARLESREADEKRLVSASEAESSTPVLNTSRRLGPADVDEFVPPVLSQAPCPLEQILKETSRHTLDFIDNLQSFSASERVEQVAIDRNGKRRTSGSEVGNFVAQVEQNSAGYPRLAEYRSGGQQGRQAVMDSGMAAFALMFHPTHIADFSFRCEGLTMLDGASVWQIHFEESPDPNKAFTAFHIGNSVYLPAFKGRAWITANSYDVMRIETDLVAPVLKVNLQREHVVIRYAPVEFQKRHLRLWLPESTAVYIAYGGRQFERVHSFGEYQLFSVDSTEAVKEPKANDKKFQAVGAGSLSSILLNPIRP
jgi:hypothetical protein